MIPQNATSQNNENWYVVIPVKVVNVYPFWNIYLQITMSGTVTGSGTFSIQTTTTDIYKFGYLWNFYKLHKSMHINGLFPHQNFIFS